MKERGKVGRGGERRKSKTHTEERKMVRIPTGKLKEPKQGKTVYKLE